MRRGIINFKPWDACGLIGLTSRVYEKPSVPMRCTTEPTRNQWTPPWKPLLPYLVIVRACAIEVSHHHHIQDNKMPLLGYGVGLPLDFYDLLQSTFAAMNKFAWYLTALLATSSAVKDAAVQVASAQYLLGLGTADITGCVCFDMIICKSWILIVILDLL